MGYKVANMEKVPELVTVPKRKRRAYSGKSARLSELAHKIETPAENELHNLICSIRQRVWAKYNERIAVESEKPDAAYFPDAVIDDFLIVEAEGEGSASADNEKRDEKLRKQGKRIIHLPNRI